MNTWQYLLFLHVSNYISSKTWQVKEVMSFKHHKNSRFSYCLVRFRFVRVLPIFCNSAGSTQNWLSFYWINSLLSVLKKDSFLVMAGRLVSKFQLPVWKMFKTLVFGKLALQFAFLCFCFLFIAWTSYMLSLKPCKDKITISFPLHIFSLSSKTVSEASECYVWP